MNFASGSVSGPSAGAGVRRSSRATTAAASSSTNGAGTSTASRTRLGASSLGTSTTTGLKRRTRSSSVDPEKELTTAKRPALSSAFSAHVAQSTLNRQLLAAQARVTELENALLEQQGEVDRLAADRRLLATNEEKEREARKKADEELAEVREQSSSTIASLRKRLSDLETDHEDLADAYATLQHTTQSQLSALRAELAARADANRLLESQRDEAEERATELESRISRLEIESDDANDVDNEDAMEDDEERMDERISREPMEDKVMRKRQRSPVVIQEGTVSSHRTEANDLGSDQNSDESSVVSGTSQGGNPEQPIEIDDDDDDGMVHDADADGEAIEMDELEGDVDEDVEGEDMSFTDRLSFGQRNRAPKVVSLGSSRLSAASDGEPPNAAEDIHTPRHAQESIEKGKSLEPSMSSLTRLSESIEISPEPQGNAFAEGGPLGTPDDVQEAYPDPGAPPAYISSDSEDGSERSESSSYKARGGRHLGEARKSVSARNLESQIFGSEDDENDGSEALSSRARSTSSTPAPNDGHVASAHDGRRDFSSVASSASPSRPRGTLKARLSMKNLQRQKEREEEKRKAETNEAKYAVIRSELITQMKHIEKLEAANARLTGELDRIRTRAEGTEVLREEKRDLERKVEGMEKLRRRVAELEEELKNLQSNGTRQQNENAPPARATSGTPVGVSQQLSAFRKKYEALLDEHGQLRAQAGAMEVELNEARTETQTVSTELANLRSEAAKLRMACSWNEKLRANAEREVGFLRELNESYKAEATADLSTEGEEAAIRANMEQRISQLETLVSEYKSTNADLRQELERSLHGGGSAAGESGIAVGRSLDQWKQLVQRAGELEDTLRSAETSASKQADRIEELEQRLFELSGEIAAGRHVPPGIRVLKAFKNPDQEWFDARQETMKKLRSENEALLERLKDLESHTAPATSSASTSSSIIDSKSVPRESWEVLKQEKEELSQVVAQKEKRLKRLQEVFTRKSEEFRNAISSILGVKLAFYPNGQVRVTSQYDLSATFVFKPEGGPGAEGEGARMQLIAAGESNPQEMEELMRYWVLQEMSIPCFLASVTLECYDKVRRERDRNMQTG